MDKPFSVVVLDSETTGLDETKARIVELAFLVCSYANGSYFIQQHSSLIYPDGGVAPDFEDPDVKRALEINKISVSQLRNAPTFAEWWPKVHPIVSRYDIWVAHNLPFDRKMLIAEIKRLKNPAWAPGEKTKLCTMRIDVAMQKGYGFKRNLKATAERWGVPIGNLHRAADDAALCWEIFKKQLDQARSIEALETLHKEGDAIWAKVIEKKEAQKKAELERVQSPAGVSPQVGEQS